MCLPTLKLTGYANDTEESVLLDQSHGGQCLRGLKLAVEVAKLPPTTEKPAETTSTASPTPTPSKSPDVKPTPDVMKPIGMYIFVCVDCLVQV